MLTFDGTTADDVWHQAITLVRSTAPVQESRDQPTRELLHATFTLQDPRQRVVFSRPINPAFAIAEVIWILAGSNDLDFLRFWNPRMQRFSDDTIRLSGAYGFRLGSQPRLAPDIAERLRHGVAGATEERQDQLRGAYEALRATSHSRQVVLQIWDRRSDLPAPLPRSKDIPCNLVSHLLVRDGKLEWLQVMRSNDLIWGTPYNFIQFTTMQEIIAGWLGVEVGTYNHVSDSLHVYERHWRELEHTTFDHDDLPVNHADARVLTYDAWETIWARMVDITIELAHQPHSYDILAAASGAHNLPLAYQQWVWLLAAEALRRRGYEAEAHDAADQAGRYWGRSWRNWAAQAPGAVTVHDTV